MTRPIKPPAVPERVVLREALSALRSLGVQASRRNVGAFRAMRGGRETLIRFGTPGEADISGTLPDGRRIEVECKRRGKRPTPKQMAYLRSVNKSKGVALWIDDASQIFDAVPKLLAGAWVDIDDKGDCFIVTKDVADEHEGGKS